MAYQMELDFGEEHVLEHQGVQRPPAIERIYEMIADSATRPLVISRLIAIEIVSAIRNMVHEGKAWRRVPYRDLINRVKACRELQRNLLVCEKVSARDHLDLDGSPFRFVFNRLVELFRTALNDAGVDAEFAQSVMLEFESQVEANDDHLRFELRESQDIEAGWLTKLRQ